MSVCNMSESYKHTWDTRRTHVGHTLFLDIFVSPVNMMQPKKGISRRKSKERRPNISVHGQPKKGHDGEERRRSYTYRNPPRRKQTVPITDNATEITQLSLRISEIESLRRKN